MTSRFTHMCIRIQFHLLAKYSFVQIYCILSMHLCMYLFPVFTPVKIAAVRYISMPQASAFSSSVRTGSWIMRLNDFMFYLETIISHKTCTTLQFHQQCSRGAIFSYSCQLCIRAGNREVLFHCGSDVHSFDYCCWPSFTCSVVMYHLWVSSSLPLGEGVPGFKLGTLHLPGRCYAISGSFCHFYPRFCVAVRLLTQMYCGY